MYDLWYFPPGIEYNRVSLFRYFSQICCVLKRAREKSKSVISGRIKQKTVYTITFFSLIYIFAFTYTNNISLCNNCEVLNIKWVTFHLVDSDYFMIAGTRGANKSERRWYFRKIRVSICLYKHENGVLFSAHTFRKRSITAMLQIEEDALAYKSNMYFESISRDAIFMQSENIWERDRNSKTFDTLAKL